MNRELPFDFTKIDTSSVDKEIISDEVLLERIKYLELVGVGGYGLIAELAKRFASMSCECQECGFVKSVPCGIKKFEQGNIIYTEIIADPRGEF